MEINNNKNIIAHVQSPAEMQGNVNCQKYPAFKSKFDGFLSKSGDAMNWIENGGFLVLFLIQDFLGMTVPRTFAGFLRDKEVTGEYNIQEGFEVLGREGLTGPCMMSVAPLSLWLASKYAGQSVSVNTELIKRYGNSLKEMLSSPDFNKELLKDGSKFKTEFFRKNIETILKQTLGEKYEGDLKGSVDYIVKQLENWENIPKDAKLKKFMGKSKYRAECMQNIASHINDLRYNTSPDLDILQKVKFGVNGANEVKTFEAKKAFEGLVKYSNDAIKFNKNLSKLDASVAESLKHNALGKRVLMNVGMIAATLGMLSVLPKLYLRGNTAPGARSKMKGAGVNAEVNAGVNTGVNQDLNSESNEKITFKGKNTGIVEKIGKAVEKNKKDFVSSELEYNGHNFTNSLMAGLSVFGLITPRCMRAYSRAEVDDKGKKDLTELWEIIIRDLSSSLAVVFAVPMITRAFVTSYEKNSGFVLMHKDRTKTGFKTVLDLLNPYTKTHVLSNAELEALYENINTKEKMVNFCKYIDKNGGDLKKILSKTEGFSELMKHAEPDNIKRDFETPKQRGNREITKLFENIEAAAKKLGKSTDKKSVDDMIAKLMKGVSKGGKSKITSFARGLNSVPGLLTTVFISPYILGWFIPRLTYKNTRRIHEKEERQHAEQEQKLKVAV